MPTPRRPRATPWLDALSLLLLAGGGVVLVSAYAGFARIEGGWAPPGVPFGATLQVNHELRMTTLGVALVVAGLVVGVVATIVTRRRERRAAAALSPDATTR